MLIASVWWLCWMNTELVAFSIISNSLATNACVGCNTLLSANFFRCLKLEFCGAGCEESHPRVRFWCCWWFRIRNTTMVCTPCASAGGRNALLPVGTWRESQELSRNCFTVCSQLKSSRLAVERRSVVCNGPAISETDFELFFENRLGGSCFAVDAYCWFF